jgi:hypothetical protein
MIDDTLTWIASYGDITFPIVLFLAVIAWLLYLSW